MSLTHTHTPHTARVAETVRRVRNSGKYLLGNTGDFNIMKHAVPYASLQPIDQYQLHLLGDLMRSLKENYETFAFSRVYFALANFLADLSSFYFVAIKDRLYAEPQASTQRRAAQTVLSHVRTDRSLHVRESLPTHAPFREAPRWSDLSNRSNYDPLCRGDARAPRALGKCFLAWYIQHKCLIVSHRVYAYID